MPSPRTHGQQVLRALAVGLGALAISAPGLACGDDEGGGGGGAYGGASGETTSEETTGASEESAAPGAVEAFDFGFGPNTITVAAGDKVTWENTGETVHNVKGKGFFSDGLEPGDSYEYEFAKAGVYDYLCTLHPDSMQGTVVVE